MRATMYGGRDRLPEADRQRRIQIGPTFDGLRDKLVTRRLAHHGEHAFVSNASLLDVVAGLDAAVATRIYPLARANDRLARATGPSIPNKALVVSLRYPFHTNADSSGVCRHACVHFVSFSLWPTEPLVGSVVTNDLFGVCIPVERFCSVEWQCWRGDRW